MMNMNTNTKQEKRLNTEFDLNVIFKIKEHYKELNIENFKIEIRSKENYKPRINAINILEKIEQVFE